MSDQLNAKQGNAMEDTIIGRLTILGLLCVNTRVVSSVGYRSCATGGTFMGMLLLGKCADPTEYIHR